MAHAGAPTKYNPEYCNELIAFFDIEPYEEREIPHMGSKGEFKWMDYKRMPNRLPTVRNFCKKIKVDYTTFYEWVKVHKEFSHALSQAEDIRKWFVIENGLNELYNPVFAKFTAINITDMKDKTDVGIQGDMNVSVKIVRNE